MFLLDSPSCFLDPWAHGISFLKPCMDGPPTEAEKLAGRNRSLSGMSSDSSQAATPPLSSASSSRSSVTSMASIPGSPLDEALANACRERRKLLKKLRQISGLQQRAADGAALDSQQVVKLATELRLRETLAHLEAQLLAAGVDLSREILSPALDSTSLSGQEEGHGSVSVPHLSI